METEAVTDPAVVDQTTTDKASLDQAFEDLRSAIEDASAMAARARAASRREVLVLSAVSLACYLLMVAALVLAMVQWY